MPWAFTTVSATTTSTTLGTLILGGGGSGYTANITNGTLTFSGGGATTQATGTFTTNANGNVSSVSLATVGSGYTSAPTVTASGGSTPATITAVLGSTATTSTTGATVGVTTNLTSTLQIGAQAVVTGTCVVTVSTTVSSGTSISINSVGTNNGFSTTSGTTDFAGATFTNSGTVHTVTAATATSLTVTPAIAVTINSGAQITLSRQAVYSVTAVAASAVALFPQTGASVPAITTGTSLTFYNPLLQSGTDTTIGTALAGLASFRSGIINAFADTSVGGGNGAVTLKLRRSSGSSSLPFIDPTPTTTFLGTPTGDPLLSRVHRVTAYNSATGVITFSPPLNAAITDNSAVTLFTPGAILNRGDGAFGLDSYTVNSTRVRITGTFTMNAWAEQLVMASNCPSDTGINSVAINRALPQLAFAGTITLSGIRSGWGSGSGSVSSTPILVGNLQGNGTIGNCFLFAVSGTVEFNNCTVQTASYIDLGQGANPSSITFTNATFVDSAGAVTGGGNLFYYSALSTINSINFAGCRHNEVSVSNGTIRSNIVVDGTAGFTTGVFTVGTYTIQNLAARNMAVVFVLRNFTATSIGSVQTIAVNNLTGSNPGISPASDSASSSGGHLIIQKQVAHSFKNLLGTPINGAKAYIIDTLNLQRFDWVSSGINRSGYTSGIGSQQAMPAIAIAGSATLTNNTTPANSWDANSQRSYLWTTDSSGTTTAQAITLAYISNPNRRIIGINCVSNGVANALATTINVDNGTTGLFANLSSDIGAPQVNGYFVWSGTRHIITSVASPGSVISIAVASGGSGYTTAPAVTIAAPGSGITALATAVLGTGVSAGIVISIVITLNGSGYTTAPSVTIAAPPVGAGNTTATASATIHPSTNTDYVLGISPPLATQIPDNTALPVQNIWYDCRNKTRVSAFIDNAAGYTVNYSVTVQNAQIIDDTTITLTATPSATPASGWTFINNNRVHTVSTYDTGTRDLTFSPPLNLGISASTAITLRNSTISSIVIDNNAGALLATTPVPYTNFIHAGEIYLITAVSSTSTEHTLTISPNLRASIADNTPITLENIPGSDFFDFRTASYPHLPQGQELNLTGTGTLTNTWTLLDDATIDRPKAQVDLDTTLTTAAQAYDRAKSWWYDNFETLTASQQGAVLVTRSGTTLNAGSYDLTLATSGSVFALSGNTITINAPTFADTLTTTGTITLNNPSASQVNYASGIVPAGGTVAVAVAGTYDLSGWTFASAGAARTISNTSGGAVTVWLNPNQVANVTGSGANLSIVAKPQSLAAPNFANGTRAYAARVQTFTIASTAIDTSTDTITLGNDSQGKAAVFATAAPWTQVAFRLAPGATLPATTGNVLKDGGFYYWSNNRLYTSIANIPVPPDTVGTPVDFTSQGSGNFTLQAETELFNTTVSGGSGLSQSLTQPDGILIRFKATKWSESAGNASATQFLDTRDSLITWSAFTGATVSTTLELEAVHEQIVATSYVQSGKYGQLFPAKRGDQFGGKFGIALEGVGTLQINADDDTSNPAGVELLQDIFLWWCWVRSTEVGIRLASYDTLTAINFTTYQAGRVEVENTDASVPLIIAGGSISFAGSSNGIAATSNAIYLNVDVLGVVAITGVAATDIRSAVGLTSANLDSQLGDITALVL